MPHILIVEDDLPLAHALSDLLIREGWTTDRAHSVREAQARLAHDTTYHLALFDVSLPDGTTLDLARTLRRTRPELPIFFLSARDDEATLVAALSLGADDYVTKPLRVTELVLRLKRSLGRLTPASTRIPLGTHTVYPDEGRLVDATGTPISLTALEWHILQLFLAHRGQLLTRDLLLDRLVEITGEVLSDNTLTVYIKRLRTRIESDPAHPTLLLTVRGLGYRLAGTDERV